MKNKPSAFLKQIFSFLSTIVKAKTMAMKNKTSAIKTRLLIFNLLRNKNVLLSKINHKIHAIMGENYSKAIVLYNNAAEKMSANISKMEDVDLNGDEDEEDDYPDLRNTFLELEDEDEEDEEDDEIVNGTGSVIDLVRNSRGYGNVFCLEDEIDHVADVFIKRFHREMRIQKQESFKRYREMLARGV
ncbi:uncharacterized protein LOC110112551 [Dendrobium catenatum]|uniref:Uncharacterized protein n=1 Tax=Dendrobium catenatum TaxID=906689 RepID=A0A2I0XE67_9ASPA|nr:uncharacterized protein LOC110112551 [Dendrobium catenatum]PKU86211.1 hypothetical protein MA16_Dca002042 [Dendrobium catenatum]